MVRQGESASPVLVTGATGYIGSRLARRLILEGREAHAVVRRDSDLSLIEGLDGLTTHVHDGADGSLAPLLRETGAKAVCHLASLFLVRHEPGQVRDLIESNILFGAQLLEAVAATGPVDFVNTGTFWQHHGDRGHSPVNLYAATKKAFEAVLQFYTETVPLRAMTLMLGDTYGPGDPRPKILNRFLELTRTGGVLDMSPGEQTLDLLHVDDVVEGYIRALDLLEEVESGTVSNYVLSSGEHVSLRDLTAVFERTSGKSLDIRWGGRAYRDREVMSPWSGGRTLPGWKPRISLEAGLQDLLGREDDVE